MAGIVHFANFYRMMENAEHAFFRSLGFSVHDHFDGVSIGWPRVAAACEFFKPLRFEEVVNIQLLVAEVRKRSVRYQFRFWKGDGDGRIEIARGSVSTVCASVDRVTGKLAAMPIPGPILSALEAAPPEVLAEISPAKQPAERN